MRGTKDKRKQIYCYVLCIVFLIFSIFMLTMAVISHWDEWVVPYVIIVGLLACIVTWNKKVSEQTQSYFLAVASMANIFVYSYMQEEFYPVIIIICSLTIMSSIYMNPTVLIIMAVLSLVMTIIHTFVLNTISFSSPEDIMVFIIRVFAMLFSQVFLAIFVHRLCMVEENLKTIAEEAKSAERSKSDFLANMSHEIRTPMNAIVGMCELILREDINENVRENCFNIQNSGRSLLAIINDILDFSKIESGKAELIEDEFNIGSTVNDVINMAITRKGEKKIEIIARVDPEIPKGLIGDEVRIKQVMINLITNAVKFTNRGCVSLKVTQSRHDYGINLNVTVRDTGIGITEENLEKLFTSFQQVDTRKNRSVEGTGLGLAISKSLVTKMGGFINVSSNYGEGSVFKFVIPLKVSDPEPFIYVKDTSKVNIAVYINMKKYSHWRIESGYRKMINELAEKFHVRFKLFEELSDLKQAMSEEEFTHCFIAKEEYKADREFFNKLADDMEVLVIQDRIDAIGLPGNIKCIYKPFYALSVAAVLNNERIIFNLNHRNNSIMRFTAPDAKVLIVDDNVTNLKVAEGLMRPYNMRIVTVMSGMNAIEALRTQDYDLVFMDHMMPEMDGVEATKLIRQMDGEYYKSLPIVALTANAVNGVKEMFLREGFNDFIAKPIELSILDRALKNWLPEELIISSSQDYEEEEVAAIATEKDSLHINHDKGLGYAGGSKEVYLEVLDVYARNGKKGRESLDKRFTEKDWEHYVIEVHALKSSSLSIGAEVLSELARELEFAGKDGKYEIIEEKQEELSKLYGEVLEEAEKYLQENDYAQEAEAEAVPEENLQEITTEEFAFCMDNIRAACDSFDGEAMVAAAESLFHCSLNGKALKPYFVKVKMLASDFEYEQALEEAEKAAVSIIG